MTRSTASSKWYLPLFSGTELSSRVGNLTSFDPDDLLGELPFICQPVGLLLWFDSAQGITAGPVAQWQDRSPAGNHAVQTDPSLRPTQSAAGVDFKD